MLFEGYDIANHFGVDAEGLASLVGVDVDELCNYL